MPVSKLTSCLIFGLALQNRVFTTCSRYNQSLLFGLGDLGSPANISVINFMTSDKKTGSKNHTSKNDASKNKKHQKSRDKDPHLAREAEKYAQPIPSREFILQTLEKAGEPMTHPQVAHVLDLASAEDFEALRRRLIAMTRDGQLVCNRRNQFLPKPHAKLVTGKVLGHRDGFGFLVLDTEGDDLFLSARQMQTVFDGDRVEARVDVIDSRGKTHAIIERVIERNTGQLVGRLFRESGVAFVEVENVRIAQQVIVPEEDALDAEHGQYVVIQITQQPSKRNHAVGKVVEILGDYMAPGMEIEVAIRSHGIPNVWPEALEQAVAQLKPEVTEAEKSERIDIRHLPLVTIDGEDARDFDDAVFCQAEGDGHRLYVAIADVSHYVRPRSPLDEEANNRGTSVYFPDHVVPMLPEVLSNGLCSLNPKVDRLCMVCEMSISRDGEVLNSQFYEAVMHSHARLTYNQVGAILEQPDSPEGIQLCEDFAELLPHLHQLYALYQVLKARREERGAIDFDTVETRIIFGPERKIDQIVPTIRNDAHKLIEECMLCANVATAEFLASQGLPSLYRVHETPGSQKLENLRAFLSELGLQLMGGEDPSPADYQSLMSQIKERPDFSVIQTVMLRSMSQAVYSPEEKGHFGLAYDHYAHFTSPIRRYPDLLTHRALKSLIYSDKAISQVKRSPAMELGRYRYGYDMAAMVAMGEHCSMCERRADDATRDVQSWLKCEYLQQHVGEVFEGLISGVTAFGFFVELANLYVEGLVHVASLEGDYFQFDAQKHRLIGERTGTRYGLGDRVMVQVAQISLEDRKVDLMLVSAEPRSRARKRTASRAKSSERSKTHSKTNSETNSETRRKTLSLKKSSGEGGEQTSPSRRAKDERLKTKKDKKKMRKRAQKDKGKPKRGAKRTEGLGDRPEKRSEKSSEPRAPKPATSSASPKPRKRRLAKKSP